MENFQPDATFSGGSQRAAGFWSPAPGIVAAYPLDEPPSPAPALQDQSTPEPFAVARQLAGEPHPDISSTDLDIDSMEALAEAEYLCAVSALRSLALAESGLAALKARVIERLDSASTRLGVAAQLEPWQQEVLAISTTAELCAALALPQRTGGELKSQSIALVRKHPDTLEALSTGSISWRNAVVALEQLETLEDLKGQTGERAISADSLDEFEHQLLDLAPGMTTAKFQFQARRLRERAHPDSIARRHAKALADRKLVLMPDRDGMSWLSMFLPADSAQGIWNQATRTARTLQGPDEHRTLTQLRVDVLAQWLLETGTAVPEGNEGPALDRARAGGNEPETEWSAGTVAHPGAGRVPRSSPGTGIEGEPPAADGPGSGRRLGGTPRPRAQVLVTIPLLTLLGRSKDPSELEGYGPIPPEMARELAAECPTLYRIMVDPYTNRFLSMDPTQYRVTGALRALLRARDGTCVFPGCNTVTDDTELDHVLAWEDGGTTVPENLKNECGVHHLLKHFKDGKSRDGTTRPREGRSGRDCAPGRESGILQGWTPTETDAPDEKPGWISPAGYLYPPDAMATTPPIIPARTMIQAIEELRGDG
ncbi:HNH endonuclease signature motif containing protein [Arthrobacter wenxiniae]|uniref:DUF222 domain-containing protein n=1 Tax=Arthrobacter wenxiniae TaxID=2713570 RepID=A0A7Y7IFM4_9MICC|nr:HNH endonuclease signature motif containing protein [Arthrobacter wenxiniae]NVM94609.1 DUF222 domain-containing protein [Arthrobacter wenxiniae]